MKNLFRLTVFAFLIFGLFPAESLALAAEKCIDFRDFPANKSVEGLNAIYSGLNIQVPGGEAVVVEYPSARSSYAAYVGNIWDGNPVLDSLREFTDDVFSANNLDRRNACLDKKGGFAIKRDSKTSDDIRFNFVGGAVSNFRMKIFDWGDFNPHNATNHSATLSAYDSVGRLVDKQSLSFMTDSSRNPRKGWLNGKPADPAKFGDACSATFATDPGNFAFKLSGNGIVKVVFQGKSSLGNQSFDYLSDTNVAFGVLCFTDFDLPPQLPTVDIKANNSDGPISLTAPASYTLSWTSNNATTCSASGAWSGSKAINGSQAKSNISAGNRTYTITCSNSAGSATDSVIVRVREPQMPIVDIKVNGSDGPIALNPLANYTLSWVSQHAVSCVGSGAWSGSKAINGSEVKSNVGPGVYTYTITCSNQYGSATDAVRVNVRPEVQLPTVDIKANNSDGPISLTAPASYTLSWTSNNATTCSASGAWSGSKAINGSQAKSNISAGNRTYTITCSNSAGSATDSVIVNVSSQPNYPTVDIKVNGSDGTVGLTAPASYTLSWTSNNATTCSASGAWSGSKNISGSESASNVGQGSYTYTITCSNQYGSANDSVTVNVTQQGYYPTVDIKVNGSDGTVGLTAPASYTLSWTSNNATTCSASGAWSGSKNISGSESASNVGQGSYTYTITCSNQYGSANDSVTVNVTATSVGVLSLSKLVRDPAITTSSVYYENLYMIPGREVEFSISVTNSGSTQVNNLYVQDSLPSGLAYVAGSTTLDGVQASDGIVSSGINIGTLLGGQSRTVKFRARLSDNAFFTQSLTLITNTAYARGDNASQIQDAANVYAVKQGQVLGAATVDTGADVNALAVMVTGLGSALSLSGLQIGKRVYWKNKIAKARLSDD